MDNKLQQKLCQDFPELFPQPAAPYKKHYAYRQVSVYTGDGWFNIIHNACKLIKSHLKNKADMEGLSLITEEDFFNISEEMDSSDREKYYIIPSFSEIKEKYGELRIYMNNTDEYVNGILDMACQMSLNTCENCGRPSRLVKEGGWIINNCKGCHNKELRRQARFIDRQESSNSGAVDED